MEKYIDGVSIIYKYFPAENQHHEAPRKYSYFYSFDQ